MSRNSNALPWVIPEYCEGCTSCVSACSRELLFMIETELDGVFVPWMEDVDQCTGCGLCEAACAWSAICLTTFVAEARERFQKHRPSAVAHRTDANLHEIDTKRETTNGPA